MSNRQQTYLDDYRQQYLVFLERLQAARHEAGLSQEEVAEQLGKSQSFVSRSEQGLRRVDLVELQAFAHVYHKPLTFFIKKES